MCVPTQPSAVDIHVYRVLSIKGHWCSLILAGLKTWEIQRVSYPAYIGQTVAICCSRTSHVWAVATINSIETFRPHDLASLQQHYSNHCVSPGTLVEYATRAGEVRELHAWKLSEVRCLIKPLYISKEKGTVTFAKPTSELLKGLPSQSFRRGFHNLATIRTSLNSHGACLSASI